MGLGTGTGWSNLRDGPTCEISSIVNLTESGNSYSILFFGIAGSRARRAKMTRLSRLQRLNK
jgi:hypothetical protein